MSISNVPNVNMKLHLWDMDVQECLMFFIHTSLPVFFTGLKMQYALEMASLAKFQLLA